MMNESDKTIAETAVALPAQIAGLECEDKETELWHLLRSLLEWCDAQHPRLDFDRILEDVRADFNA